MDPCMEGRRARAAGAVGEVADGAGRWTGGAFVWVTLLLLALGPSGCGEPEASGRTGAAGLPPSATWTEQDPEYLATFSILARDPGTGELGVGVQSKAFAAGNRAMHAKGGVAVIAHQASANPMHGVLGIELLERGYAPEEALEILIQGDEGRDRRQTVILDSQGRSAGWSGPETSDWKGHRCGDDYCVQGNILAGPQVVEAMARSFESTSGPLAERLMDALDAAQAAGGDARGMQSGALLVVHPRVNAGFSDRVVDIRVDDHREPLVELRRVLNVLRSNQIVTQVNQRLAQGEVEGALEAALEATELSPENDRVWIALAQARLAGGQQAEALAALEEAVSLNPWNRDQLPRNPSLRPLLADPGFQRLLEPGR